MELTERVAALESTMTNVRVDMAEVKAKMTGVENRLDTLERRTDDGFKDMRSDFKWVIGIQITTLVAIMTLIAKAGHLL